MIQRFIPELRFQEFSGGWELTTFGEELIDSRLGGNYENSEKVTPWSLIKMGNLARGKIKLDKIQYITEAERINPKDKIQTNDLFFNTRNTLDLVGKVAIWRDELPEAYYNSNLMYIQFPDNNFMNYRLNSWSGIKSLRRLATGTTSVAAIYTRDLLKMPIVITSLPEQQKIAAFLSAVDTKIQQLQRKKELLEQYKKRVMQKIFSQEIRFKPALSNIEGDENGNNYPDWEDKQLGQIITFFSTNSFSRKDLNYERGIAKNIHYGDIHTTFKARLDIDAEHVPYINDTINLNKIAEESYCRIGDIVIADASEDYDDIGKTVEIWNAGEYPLVSGLHTFLGRDLSEQTVIGFKGYLFQSQTIRKQIRVLAQGISVLGISKKNVMKIKFELPCIEEQLSIVTLLSVLDDRIESLGRSLKHTRHFKKGLLQQMFI